MAPKRTIFLAVLATTLFGCAIIVGFLVLGAIAIKNVMDANLERHNNPGHPDVPHTILRHGGSVVTLAYSPDSKYLIAGTKGTERRVAMDYWIGEIRIYDVAQEKEHAYVKLDQWIAALAFHPAGDKLVVAASSFNNSGVEDFMGFKQALAEIIIFEFPSMKKLKSTQIDTVIHDADYSFDGKFISLTRTDEKKLHHRECVILDAETLDEKLVISDPKMTCGLGLVDREGKSVYVAFEQIGSAAGRGRTATIRISDQVDLGEFAPGSSSFNRMKLTRNEDELEIYSKNAIFFYDLKNQKYSFLNRNIHGEQIRRRDYGSASCLSPDRSHAVVVGRSASGFVYLYDYSRGKCTKVFESRSYHGTPEFPVCAFAPDGRTFAVGARGFRNGKENPRGQVLLFKMPRGDQK